MSDFLLCVRKFCPFFVSQVHFVNYYYPFLKKSIFYATIIYETKQDL